ncbi:hypothetical protein AB205_0195200, partial [Aquarana catesbeiana]
IRVWRLGGFKEIWVGEASTPVPILSWPVTWTMFLLTTRTNILALLAMSLLALTLDCIRTVSLPVLWTIFLPAAWTIPFTVADHVSACCLDQGSPPVDNCTTKTTDYTLGCLPSKMGSLCERFYCSGAPGPSKV